MSALEFAPIFCESVSFIFPLHGIAVAVPGKKSNVGTGGGTT
jgi:hypothetical protein